MYARRIDANQPKVVKELRKVYNYKVKINSAAGNGEPDFIIPFNGFNFLVELKDPSKPPSARKLTKAQEFLHKDWPGQIVVLHSAYDINTYIQNFKYPKFN